MTDGEIRVRIQAALKRFLVLDGELLERDAGERAIAGRLAVHLAPLFPDHHVDVEYNRHGFDAKVLDLPLECRGGGRRKIVPDIVIHRRGVAIEIKRETNGESRECDRAKLRAMKRRLGYQAAVLIDLPAGAGATGRKIEVDWQ